MTEPNDEPIYPGLKMILVVLIAALPILADGELSSAKTWINAALPAATALYALVNKTPKLKKRAEKGPVGLAIGDLPKQD